MTEVTPYYDKKIQCLACRHSYSTTKIRSRFVKVKGHESDFCPLYSSNEINPLLYNVTVCPRCGFSFTDEFSKYIVPVLKKTSRRKSAGTGSPRTTAISVLWKMQSKHTNSLPIAH
jgi:uncharacterized protein